MPTVSGPGPYQVTCRPGETLLDAWLRSGIAARFSCRGGSCHTCLLRCTAGELPARAQRGLAPHLQRQGCFLPCLCLPTGPLEVAPVEADHAADRATRPHATAPEAAPDLWIELGNGSRVRAVLEDFYARVFADPLLAPYFRNVTQAHVIGKQYAFLHDEMQGRRQAYFGDNVRNVHHWMVIPEAVFQHRQQLMATVLRGHGLSEDQVARWLHVEERHKGDIVKDTPWPREFGGHALPDGYAEETLSCGAVCDHCGGEVPAGTTVLYHQRLGTISCPACRPDHPATG